MWRWIVNDTVDGYARLLTVLLPGPDLHCTEPLALLRFSQHLSVNYRKDQKKPHHLSAEPLDGTVPYYGKSGPGYCITIIKRLDESMR